MSVCVSQKSLFTCSRDFVVSHVYSYIPYSKNLVVSMFLDTFCSQGIWSFPCFLTHSILKRIGGFHVFWHIPRSKELAVSMIINTFPFHNDLYKIGAVCLFVCLSQKGTTFRTQKIWSFLKFIATFRTQRNWSFPCFLTLLSVLKRFGCFSCL